MNEITTLQILPGALFLAFGILLLGYQYGLFTITKPTSTTKFSTKDLVVVFVFYLVWQIVLPGIALTVYSLISGIGVDKEIFEQAPPALRQIVNGSIVVFLPLGIYLFSNRYLPDADRKAWGKPIELSTIIYGSAMWFIGYPVVFAASQIVRIIILDFIGAPVVTQAPVQALLLSQGNPWIFGVMILSIILLIPVGEEILFRGYLQRWLNNYFNSFTSITISSFVFALFHLSTQYGWGNLEFFTALLIISYFLGLVYEKSQSLWAPIALHATFNGLSILLLFLT